MYYFRKNDNEVRKYKVFFNKEKLLELREKMINDCSTIVHKEFKSDYNPVFEDRSLIKNFTYEYVGEKEYFEETRDVYLYKYDEYKPPYLVHLIDRIIKEDITAIDELFSFDIKKELSIEDKIKIINQKIYDEKDIHKKKNLLNDLEDLYKTRDNNQGKNSIEHYYKELMGLIQLDLIDKLPIQELARIESFLGIDITYKKVLKKEHH